MVKKLEGGGERTFSRENVVDLGVIMRIIITPHQRLHELCVCVRSSVRAGAGMSVKASHLFFFTVCVLTAPTMNVDHCICGAAEMHTHFNAHISSCTQI